MQDEQNTSAGQTAAGDATAAAKTLKYKVLKEWVNGDKTHNEGDEVELDEEAAAPLLEDGTIEPVAAE